MKKEFNRAIAAMRTKLFIFSLLSATLLMTACQHPEEPQQQKNVDAEMCLELLLPYYPYTIDEEFIYVNETTGRRWEAKAYDRRREGIYPETRVTNHQGIEEGEISPSYGDWETEIHAFMLEKGVEWKEDKITTQSIEVLYDASEKKYSPATLYCMISIRLSRDEYYQGNYSIYCYPNDIPSLLTDTIFIPITYHRGAPNIAAPEGSYARIIKNQGLAEFSVDGKTVWKRVKE